MNERIKELRQKLKLRQLDFAQRIGLSRNYIAMVEMGQREPSDRTISDICRVFDVSEQWLRTGEGEMFVLRTRDEEIAAALAGAIAGESSAKDRLIRALARLPDDAFPLIERFVVEMAEKLKEEEE